MEINAQNITDLFCFVADSVMEKEQYLCELDSVVGDGDHGITMTRGFSAAKAALLTCDGDISVKFEVMGKALMGEMGGAIGPIFGTLFQAFAKETVGKETLTTADFSKMFENGLKMIKIIADVKEGQKTLLDALSPATQSLNESKELNDELVEALKKAAVCAEQGAVETTNMVAKKGRARFLKEKSIG
ncbi:MAG: dihydroxyacetone kinase subunit DhaL, partial [Eubacteriales bacterium]|nr:dihydroxyacetone kinase subunit DhaL [Eubacteriales bacterium]